MKKLVLISFLTFVYLITIHAQAVYVDSNIGSDNNTGTEKFPVLSINKAAEIIKSKDNNFYVIKINPGVYVLEKHVSVETEKEMTNKRIIIEASLLPDDTSWTPEKMPVIITKSKKGEILERDLWIKDSWITSFYINESHVTIRGIKFLGYNYPVAIYYPISRFNKEKTDLIVEQCVFLADRQSSVIQVGVIGHGNEFKVDHCVFYNANNAVIYWQDSGKGRNTGNCLSNCIIFGASESAFGIVAPENNLVFENNIITNCGSVWIRESSDTTVYSINNSIITNYQHYQGNWDHPQEYKINEKNVIKVGEISLRTINTIWEPWPIDHLHVIPKTLGSNIGAGIFKYIK